MEVKETYIKGLLILKPKIYEDGRGWFMESFNQNKFNHVLKKFGQKSQSFVQDNHSLSNKSVLRGLHYQKFPYEQGKLIRVIQGKIWDVAVDIRPNSPTFRKWVGVEISGINQIQFWIPQGFAHGFIALENNTHLVYKVTEYYVPEFEETIKWDDPSLAIDWPLTDQESVTLSLKDMNT